MRIAIDCRWIFARRSGIGVYTDTLSRGLSSKDRHNTYLLIKEPLASYGLFSLKNQIKLPRLLRRLEVNIYHSTNFMIPLFMRKSIKVVITIHDLIPWKFPQYTPKAKKTKFKWLFKIIMKFAVRRADKIIAVSENTAKDIRECLNVPDEKIHVVYNGIEPEYFVGGAEEEKEDFILFIGRADPYKNLAGLVKAYSILVRKHNISTNILVVGEDDPRYPEVKNLVKSLGLEKRIIFKGYSETAEIAELYKKAKIFVMPSIYEGFGLPVIEAMALGAPVVISNTPALVEISGGCALAVDPNNYEEMAEALYKIISDSKTAKELVKKGREHAKQFTMERMAGETLKVYESCFGA